MKTLYALVGVCMSLHAFAASAETPAIMADDHLGYFSSTDDLDVREVRAAHSTTPDARVAAAPAIANSFAVNWDTDVCATADIVPGINAIPQCDEDHTGSSADPRETD